MSEEKVLKKDIEKEVKLEDISKLNLFSKLQNVRAELSRTELTKSARNDFNKYNYFELSDFLPTINELCAKYHVFTYCDINSNIARITAVDCDNPEMVFTLTMDSAEVELKGMNKIQGIGSQNTYMRRYLYMALFEISETDEVDADTGKPEKSQKSKSSKKDKKPEDDKKAKMKQLCTSLSADGRNKDVVDILTNRAKVKNPNSITDEKIIDEIIKDLEALK